MTVDFDRTAPYQCNHQFLTEFQRVLTEQYWLLCFDRTTCLTEHLEKLGLCQFILCGRLGFCLSLYMVIFVSLKQGFPSAK